MKKTLLYKIFLSVLAGIGSAFFAGTQFISVWTAHQNKGLAALSGLAVLGIAAFLILVLLTGKRSIQNLSPELQSALLIIVAAFAGFIVLAMPLPQRLTPDRFQMLVIQPEAGTAPALIEEIKINGEPVVLADHLPSAGWQSNPFGVESTKDSTTPFVVKKTGDPVETVAILFGKGPSYGQAKIRLGWDEQTVDLFLTDRESETSIEIAANPDLIPWSLLYKLSVWFMLTGIFIILAGILLSCETLTRLTRFFIEKSTSIMFWVLISFLFWYGFCFARNVFFDASHFMQNGNFLPAIRPIGNDLNLILRAGDSVASGGSPYVGANKYPPFATVLFVPLAIIDKQAAFQIQTLLIYLSYGFVTLLFPLLITRRRSLPPYAWFLFAAGLFSYGLLFEIERGQFNLTAIACSFLAVFIFHRYPQWRWLAFALMTIGIQLKLYPAIFILFFMDDWRKWKTTLIYWVSLGLVNAALFFILGKDIAFAYLSSLFNIVNSKGLIDWPGAHSILGFLSYFNNAWGFSDDVIKLMEKGFQLAVVLMVLLCAYQAYRKKRLLDPYFFLSCTLAALTIPALSHDYTLSYLVGPAILLLLHINDRSSKAISAGTLAVLIFCFTGTFFSYLQKPVLIQNQFPALFIMLVCTAILSWRDRDTDKTLPESVK